MQAYEQERRVSGSFPAIFSAGKEERIFIFLTAAVGAADIAENSATVCRSMRPSSFQTSTAFHTTVRRIVENSVVIVEGLFYVDQ